MVMSQNPSKNTAANALSPEELDLRAYMQGQFADVFVKQARQAQMGTLLAITLIGLIFWYRIGPMLTLLWLIPVLTLSICRFLFTKRFVEYFDRRKKSTFAIMLILGTAGLITPWPLFLFDQLTLVERSAVSIILIAMATAAISTTMGYRSIYLVFTAPILGALALAWAWFAQGVKTDWASSGLGALLIVYTLFLYGMGKQYHHTFAALCRLRYSEKLLNKETTIALERANEAGRAKTQFLAAASHDLRQPIHAMNALVAALSLRDLDPRSTQIVTLLNSVNKSLTNQLDGLLDISKLDAGTVIPTIQQVRLDQLISSHHASLIQVGKERGIVCHLMGNQVINVSTDPSLLLRILSNLTDNALKFTPEGGMVTLKYHADQQEATVSVIDTGIGIPAEEQERVFQEFYQVANVERDRSKGLGLGLSIVKRLADLINVKLKLSSVAGQGTTISLVMPVIHPSKIVHEVTQAPSSYENTEGHCVLIIDDEKQVLQSMELLLSELGCRVLLAEGSEEAEKLARETPHIDAVISDYRLRSGDSGLIALAKVKQYHPTAKMALATGDTAPDRIREAQSAGFQLLHKPVSLDTITQMIKK